MVMISERPAKVEDRAVPGHWEGDLITGAANKSAIGTPSWSARPVSRYCPSKPHGHGAEQVLMLNSLTWGPGSELARHKKIGAALDMQVYFCDPHCLGSAARTRTRTASFASTSRRGPT